jgi:hypothetical protein
MSFYIKFLTPIAIKQWEKIIAYVYLQIKFLQYSSLLYDFCCALPPFSTSLWDYRLIENKAIHKGPFVNDVTLRVDL